MINKRILSRVLVALLFSLPSPAAEPQLRGANVWSRWLSTFTASTPWVSANRLTPWKLTKSHFESLLSGEDFPLQFAEPTWYAGREWTESSFRTSVNALKGELAIERDRFNARDKAMAQSIREMATHLAPKELLLVYVGMKHCRDFFLTKPSLPVHYASHSLNKDSAVGNVADEQFEKAKDRPWMPYGREYSVVYVLDGLLAVKYFNDHFGKVVPEVLLTDVPVDSRTVLFCVYHGMRDVSMIDELPAAEALKAEGIASVRIAFENLPPRPRDYSYRELFARFDDKSLYVTNSRKDRKQFESQAPPSAVSLILSGRVQSLPEIMALINKAKGWSKSGIRIRYLGLNEP